MRTVPLPLVLALATMATSLHAVDAVPRLLPSPNPGEIKIGSQDGAPAGQVNTSFTQNNNTPQDKTNDHCANKSKRSDPSSPPSDEPRDKEGGKGSGTNPGKEKCDCSQSNAFQPRANTTFMAANLFMNMEPQVDNSTSKNCQSSGQFASPLTNLSFSQVPGQSLSPGGCGSCGGGAPFMPSGRSSPSNLMPDFQLIEAPRDGVANAAFGDQSHTFDFRMVTTRTAANAVFSLQVPGRAMIDHVFSTTDLVTFTNQVHRGRKSGATMVGTDTHLILTTESGWTLAFPRPASMDVVASGQILRAERVQPVGDPPINLGYDGSGRLTSIQGPLGGYALTYGPVLGKTLVTSVTAPDGRTLAMGYVKDGATVRLASMTHPDGSVSSWGYTGRRVTFGPHYEATDIHREWRAVNPNFDYGRNRVVVQYRDKDGRITLAEDGEGRDLFYREANGVSDGRLWRQFRNFTGNRTVWWHDGDANVVRVVGLDTGSDHQFAYDAQKRIIGAIDELGRSGTVSYFRDTQLLTSIRYPDGTSMVWNRRDDGRITSVVDRLGRTTQVERDEGSRIDATTNPDGTVERQDFNDWGQPIQTRDARGHVTEYRYAMSGLPADAATAAGAANNRGYLVQVIQPADQPGDPRPVWTYTWDPVTKDCLRMTDPAGRTYDYTYDLLHRAVRIDFADGTHEALTYGVPTDPITAGLVVAHRDRVGQVTSYDYDRSGLKTRETAPDGTVTAWFYDNTGKVRDRVVRGDSETLAYDGAGRLVSRTVRPTADRALTTRTIYDTRSEVVAVVDPYGRTTGTVYDVNNRPIRTVQGLTPSALDYGAVTGAPLDSLPWSARVSARYREIVSATQSPVPGTWIVAGRSGNIATGSYGLLSTPMWTNGSLSATLAGMAGGRTWAKAGLVVRSTQALTSPMLFVGRERNGKVWGFYRLSDNKTVTVTGPTISATAALELSLSRAGRWHTASWRQPGGDWQVLAKVDLPATATSEIGLAVDGDDWSSTVTATFADVAVVRQGPLAPAAVAKIWERHLLDLGRNRSDLIITENTYDLEGQLIARTDGRGVTTTYRHDALGRVVEMVEAAFTAQSATTAYQYDDEGNLVEVRTPRFFDPTDTTGASVARTVMTYTGRNQVASVTEAPGTLEAGTTITAYTRTGKPLRTTDALGRTTTYQYDPCCDRLIKVTDPTGAVTEFRYDGEGRRVLAIDPNGLATVTAYDPRGRVSLVITALSLDAVPCCGGLPDVGAIVGGLRTRYVYDDGLVDGVGLDAEIPGLVTGLALGLGADGSAVAVTNPNGETSVQVMDGLGRVVRRIDPLGHVTTMVHDQVVDGLLTATVINPLGHTTSAAADGAGRTLRTVDALGYSSTAAYDANGNRISWRDAAGVGQDCGFDLRNRDVSCLDTTGALTTRTYDLDSNLIAVTDAQGKTERHTYDARGRKTATTDRIEATTEFTYDAHGNLIRIRDAEGGETEYRYDPRHLLEVEVFPDGQRGRTRKEYAYDAGRRLTRRQVGIGQPGAFTVGLPVETTTYAYDRANRLITRGYDDGLADSFAYDPASRLISADSARYQTSVDRSYDADGRLISETQSQADVGSWSVGYAYDAAHRQTTVTYPDGSQAVRDFDPRAQLSSVTFAGTLVASRLWDAAGRLTQTTYGNRVVENRTYTPGDHTVATIKATGPGGAAVTDFTYTYDALKRKTAEIDPILAGQTFGYDAQSRLTVWTATGGVLPAGPSQQTWDLSPVGDWRSTTIDGVSTTRSHTAVHEIKTIGEAALGYDVKGNLTLDDRGQRYAWDPENRMTAAWVPAGPRSATDSRPAVGADARYLYDALGRRVAKVVNGMRTVFVHDGAQVITEEIAKDTGAPAPGPAWNAPASGGILPGMSTTDIPTAGQVLRINFQPSGTPVPAGFLADTGAASATRGALHFGWSSNQSAEAEVTRLAPSPEWDTFIETTASGAAWAIDLPNGTYPIAIVSGDAAYDGRTNAWILDGGAGPTVLLDQDPGPTGYLGDFDVWATTVTVSNGRLVVRASGVSVRPTLCFLEIAAAGSTLPASARGVGEAIASHQVPTEEGLVDAEMAFAEITKRFVYSTRYIDEPFMYTVNGAKYYIHQNHLFSVSAVTDAAGSTRERYSYTSYGDRVVRTAAGVQLAKSQVNNCIAYTGHWINDEIRLSYARSRYTDNANGRFVSRDQGDYNNKKWQKLLNNGRIAPVLLKSSIEIASSDGSVVSVPVYERSDPVQLVDYGLDRPKAGNEYADGYSLYKSYFSVNFLDPYGTACKKQCGVFIWNRNGFPRRHESIEDDLTGWSTGFGPEGGGGSMTPSTYYGTNGRVDIAEPGTDNAQRGLAAIPDPVAYPERIRILYGLCNDCEHDCKEAVRKLKEFALNQQRNPPTFAMGFMGTDCQEWAASAMEAAGLCACDQNQQWNYDPKDARKNRE